LFSDPKKQQHQQPQRDYEIFAPSHPQAVNQYVKEYNYYAPEQQEPDPDYDEAMQQYQMAVSREYCDFAAWPR